MEKLTENEKRQLIDKDRLLQAHFKTRLFSRDDAEYVERTTVYRFTMNRYIIQVLFWFMAAGSTQAHHGIANFDLNTDLELTGVVTGVEFLNPHSWLYLNVTNTEGEIKSWRCEMRGSTVLRRSGWTVDMFPAGMQITITGAPDRNDPAGCYLGTLKFPDGTSINRYGQIKRPTRLQQGDRPLRLAGGVPNFSGDWAAEQLVMTDPRGIEGTLVPISISGKFKPGEVPGGGPGFPGARGTEISLKKDPVDSYWNRRPSRLPLTEAGAAVMEKLDLSTGDNPRLRCSPTNILFDWYFEMDVNRIIQTQDKIRMLYGSMGIDRTIHLDMKDHPDDIEPGIEGHSIGHWEDDILVVDTIGFKPGILNADGRIPHGDQLHIIERFSLDPGKMALQRSYVAEDPLYFTGRFTGSDTMYISDLPYHGTTPCEDRTHRTGDDKVRETENKPWWKLWD